MHEKELATDLVALKFRLKDIKDSPGMAFDRYMGKVT